MRGSVKELPTVTTTSSPVTTTTTTQYIPNTTTTTTPNGGSYMQKMAADIHIHEDPSSTEMRGGVDYGKIEKKTY